MVSITSGIVHFYFPLFVHLNSIIYTREQAADDKALKIIKQMDCSSEELIEKAYEKLDEYLPLVGITREQAIKTVEYLEKQRKRCNKGGSAFTKMSGLFKKK